MNALKSGARSLLEIQVGQQKIHDQTSRTAGRIVVSLQHVAQGHYVLGSFQRVIIVGILTQGNSACSELLITFAVAHANAPPTIALQQDQRSGKGKELGSLPLAACHRLLTESNMLSGFQLQNLWIKANS